MRRGGRIDVERRRFLWPIMAGSLTGVGLLCGWAVLDRFVLAAHLGSWSLLGVNAGPLLAGGIAGVLAPREWKQTVISGTLTGSILALITSLGLVAVSLLDGLGNPIDVVDPTLFGSLLLGLGVLLLLLPYFLVLSLTGALVANRMR